MPVILLGHPMMVDVLSTKTQQQHAMYRRELCQFLSSLKHPILKELETTLGQHALQLDHTSVVPCTMTTVPRQKEQSEEQLDMRVPPCLFHCHCCGAYLQGRVRSQAIRRGSTRRRRASRRLAQRKREQKRQSTTRYTPTPTISSMKNDSDKYNKELIHLFQVTDGTCKNVVVQTCELCSTQRKIKGLPARKTPPKNKHTAGIRTESNLKTQAKLFANNKRKNLACTGEQLQRASKIKSDLATISATAVTTTTTPAPGADASRHPLLQPLSLFEKSKKKKRKTPEPKSDLMNFLSSFNTH